MKLCSHSSNLLKDSDWEKITKNLNWLERWGYSFVHGYLISNLSPLTYQRLISKLVEMSLPPTLSQSTSTMPSTNDNLPSSNATTTTTSTDNIPQILINGEPEPAGQDLELQVIQQ